MSRIIQDRFSITDNEEDMMEAWLKNRIHDIHTAQPCHVVRFNPENATVDVRLGVMRDVAGQALNVRVLEGLPISYPVCSNGFKITFPIEEGSTGHVVFCESSIDRWLTNPEITNPLDTRMHDYTDGVFHAGIKKYIDVKEPIDDENMCIQAGESLITLGPNGDICVEGGSEFTKIKFTMNKSGQFCIETPFGEFNENLVEALTQISLAVGGAGAVEIAKLKLMVCAPDLGI